MYAGNERRNRMVALVLAIVLVAGVVLALLATVVQAAPARASTVVRPVALPAHATLVSISPADGAELSTGPTQIRLTFDDAISPQFLQLRVTRDGSPVTTSAPTVDRSVVTAEVTEKAEPGAYRIAWQVTSDDGHPVSGESAFTVLGAGGARPKVTPTYKTPQSQPTTFGHPDHLPGLIVAGVLLLGGIALLWYEHRRRSRDPGHGQSQPADVQDRQRIS